MMAPYIAVHRGTTMIIHIPGEIILDNLRLKHFMTDIALLKSIGVKILIVGGCTPQINHRLKSKNIDLAFDNHGNRITDSETLQACKDAGM